MLREPFGLIRTRVGLSVGRMAVQAVAALALAFALIFAVAGAVLWYMRTDSPMAALFALAGVYVAIAVVALIAVLIIGMRQRRVRRESSVTSAVTAALVAQPALMRSGLGLFKVLRRSPLLALGGALVAGLVLTNLGGSRKTDSE